MTQGELRERIMANTFFVPTETLNILFHYITKLKYQYLIAV